MPAILPEDKPKEAKEFKELQFDELLSTIRLKQNLSDKKGTHLLDKFRRLPRRTHVLYKFRQGIQIRSDKANDKFIVIPIEAVTLKTDINGVTSLPITPTKHPMLHENLSLLNTRQLVKSTYSTQRIPNRPRMFWVKNISWYFLK